MELQLPLDTREVYLQFPVNLLGFGVPGQDIALLDLPQAQAKVFSGKGRRKMEPESISQVLNPKFDFFSPQYWGFYVEEISQYFLFCPSKGGEPIPQGISSWLQRALGALTEPPDHPLAEEQRQGGLCLCLPLKFPKKPEPAKPRDGL